MLFLTTFFYIKTFYPFGSLLPKRHGSTDSYRYGFQGQEKDDEIKGEGNSLNYKYRMHDPRVGRFFAVDPLAAKYNWNSPYAFSENDVIAHIELEGLEKSWPQVGRELKKSFSDLFDSEKLKAAWEEIKSDIMADKKLPEPKDNTFDKVIYEAGKFVLELNPLFQSINAYEQQTTGKNFWGKEASKTEKTFTILGAIPFVGSLKHLEKLKFLKKITDASKLEYANVYGKCAEFCTEFLGKYGDDVIDSGAEIIKYEVNIGDGGLIGTMTKRLSDNGMHQFIEVIEDGKSIIFDNLHPEGIAKDLYNIDGFIDGKVITNLIDNLEYITKEIITKSN